MGDEIYTEVKGTLCRVNGERGTVVHIMRKNGTRTGALIRLDERPVMLHAILGRETGEWGGWSEVLATREVDRDEFDRLTGIAEARRSLGWYFAGEQYEQETG